MKDLTTSGIDRQNVLNNRIAVERMQTRLGLEGMMFEGEYRFTKKMVAEFYGVDERTIERCIESNTEELLRNGYFLCKGKRLKDFKLRFAHDNNVGSKTTQLGLFNFRSFLNIGMLLTGSERARTLRGAMLDMVIATINEKTGGGTKYINRRDINYIPAAIAEENYRRNLTSAINECVEGHRTYKYAQITDFIYQTVFREEQGIRKTLEFVENDEYYPEFADKLTYIVYAFCAGHYFYDGNKRMSLTMGAYFLHKNAMYWHACL